MSSLVRIHLLTSVDDLSVLNFPIHIHRSRLLRRNLDIRFHYCLSPHLAECDFVWINSKFFKPWFVAGRRQEVLATLDRLKQGGASLFWFDTTDGTGTTQFEVMPYVSAYFKGQLLRDRKLYLKQHYGGRITSAFYHRQFDVEDAEDNYSPPPLREVDLPRLHLSWNSSLGCGWSKNYYSFGAYYQIYAGVFRHAPRFLPAFPVPLSKGLVRIVDPSVPRPNAIAGRFQTRYRRASIQFHRERIRDLLHKRSCLTDRISPKAYKRELTNSRIGVSPFGWGEVCLRDWDLTAAGLALVKPDVSHMDTWPAIYVPHKTYIPFSWDFSDFDDVLNKLVDDPLLCNELAKNAQSAYLSVLSEEGRELFCDRVKDWVQGKL